MERELNGLKGLLKAKREELEEVNTEITSLKEEKSEY